MKKKDYIVVFITAGSGEEAERIGKALVDERLTACANIVPRIKSIFHWEGKVCNEEEALLILKSKEALFQSIKDRVMELHSYDVPEIIAISIHSGSEDYLNWIHESLRDEKIS